MELSVIILNYKVPYLLLQCIESVRIATANLDAEIIVVDNNSQDESCELVQQKFPQVKLIASKENGGFSKGNNMGIRQAQGKYICLLNPDMAVAEHTFQKVKEFAAHHPNFGAIGVKLMDGKGNFLPESKRNLPTPGIALKKLLGNSKPYYSSLSENENGQTDILVGAFMFMQKDRYLAVGGLDEDYFMYGEDIDLSYKFLKAGYHNYYLGSETVLHYKGESSAKDAQYRKRFYEAMAIFYDKHFKQSSWASNFIKIGLHFAKYFHKVPNQLTAPQHADKEMIYVGQSEETLSSIQLVYQKPVSTILPNQLDQLNPNTKLIIFDADFISYRQIFKQMEKLSKGNNLFRIKPPHQDFIVGSDSSTTQGSIQFLK